MPQQTNRQDYPGFGRALDRSGPGAKESIFPRNVPQDTLEMKEQYKRTHGSYEPGEMPNRQYNWPKAIVENARFHFGVVDPMSERGNRGAGAKSALAPDLAEQPLCVPATEIVKSSLANFLQVTHDHLGAPRNLLQNKRQLPNGHTFGSRPKADEYTAASLVHGFYSAEEQQPDADLGRCLTVGKRNFLTQVPLGVPTVRRDIPAPPIEKRSVANSTNFGDDADAGALIFPQRTSRNVTADDFQVRRPKEEVRGILQGAGFGLGESELEAVFEEAVQRYGDGEQAASLEVIMGAMLDWTGSLDNTKLTQAYL